MSRYRGTTSNSCEESMIMNAIFFKLDTSIKELNGKLHGTRPTFR